MMDASICGLGQAAPNPALTVMKYFPQEIEAREAFAMERVTTQQLAMMPIEFKLNGRTVVGRPDETIIETAKQNGVEIPHLCYKDGTAPRRQLPRLRGRDQGRARAGAFVLPLSEGGDGGHHQQPARADLRRRWCSSCCSPTCPRRSTRKNNEARPVGEAS